MEQREIIFRGRRIDAQPHEEQNQWVYGYFGLHPVAKGGPDICFITDSATKNMYRVDPSTVGQYTGLRDKNGKEIYEGDVVSFNNKTGVVAWMSRWAKFQIAQIATAEEMREMQQSMSLGQSHYDFPTDAMFVTIIGTIFQNPNY